MVLSAEVLAESHHLQRMNYHTEIVLIPFTFVQDEIAAVVVEPQEVVALSLQDLLPAGHDAQEQDQAHWSQSHLAAACSV